MKSTILAAAFAALLPFSALAQNIAAENPFGYAAGANAKATGAYLTITNSGPADKLIAAKSDVAKRTELHESLMVDGVMKMRAVEALDLPEGGKIEMKPGGLHVMLMGLTRPLAEGEIVPITLMFESGAELVVETPMISRKQGGAHSSH